MPSASSKRSVAVQAAIKLFHKEVVAIAMAKARVALAGNGVLPPLRTGKPRTIAELLDNASTEVAQRVVSSALKNVCTQAGAHLDFH